MIRDTTAHRISSEWHSGQNSALYALSSSGGTRGIARMMATIITAQIAPSAVVRPRSTGVRDGYTYPILTNTSTLSTSRIAAFTTGLRAAAKR